MPVSRPLEERFHEKYTIDPSSDCWSWTAAKSRDGYGIIALGIGTPANSSGLAHRVSYELLVGPIPEGLVIDHLCRNRACVNPAHLEAVTLAVNVLRGEGACAQHARRASCKYGHPYDGTRKDGKRRCLRCAADASARYLAKKRARLNA